MILLIFGSAIYFAEQSLTEEERGDTCGTPCFSSIISSFWAILATVTTVGYGDSYPMTFFGRFVASATSCIGVIMLALPICVFESNFTRMYLSHETCNRMLKDINNYADGQPIDAAAIEEWIATQIVEGRLQPPRQPEDDADEPRAADAGEMCPLATLDPCKLLAVYDGGSKGWLSEEEALLMMADLDEYHEPDDTERLNALVHEMTDLCVDSLSLSLGALEKRAFGEEYSQERDRAQTSIQDLPDAKPAPTVLSFRFWAMQMHSLTSRQGWSAPVATIEKQDKEIKRIAAGITEGTVDQGDLDRYYDAMAVASECATRSWEAVAYGVGAGSTVSEERSGR